MSIYERIFPEARTWSTLIGAPYITVSAKGIANGKSTVPNDGADFGPDTPGTLTSGIQEAIDYGVPRGYKIFLKSGRYVLKGFTLPKSENPYNAVIEFPNTGYNNGTAPYLFEATIEGEQVAGNLPAESANTGAYSNNGVIIDASNIDLIGYAGSNTQGRIFHVPRGPGTISQQPYHISIKNINLIVPMYSNVGTGPNGLFQFGDPIRTSSNQYPSDIVYMNGIDLFFAATADVENVTVTATIFAQNSQATEAPVGTGVGVVFPKYLDEGNVYGRGIGVWGMVGGVTATDHLVVDQMYIQAARYAIYDSGGSGHGSWWGLITAQEIVGAVVQHELLPNITSGLSGFANDPVIDEYGGSYTNGSNNIVIEYVNLENTGNLLTDDTSAPDNVIFRTVGWTGSAPTLGTGINLRIHVPEAYGGMPTPTLSANPPVSGTVYRNTNPYDIEIDLPVYATTSGTLGTVAYGVSSGSIVTEMTPKYVSGDTSSGAVDIVRQEVPAGWYYEYTYSGVTAGTAIVHAR